ncbi:MAG: hypothetical protein INF91_04845 [Alphaproteobacteria bacterium]|nr:hypothetical protein [Alphaproteobacteria bacterium]
MTVFDITKVAAEETSTFELLNGNDEPLLDDKKKPISITVYGPGSEPFAIVQSRQNARAIERLRKKGKADQTPAQRFAEQAEDLADLTVSFNGFGHPEHPNGGREMFKAVYGDRKLGFIAEQVSRHVGDWSHFTKR